eukprot:1894198-Pyramimonas_sp.AAC.1
MKRWPGIPSVERAQQPSRPAGSFSRGSQSAHTALTSAERVWRSAEYSGRLAHAPLLALVSAASQCAKSDSS